MTKHEKAISEYRDGYLILPLEEKHPSFCGAYDTWYEEKEPLRFDKEDHMANRISSMTPDEAWNTYVGSQSTSHFVAFANRAVAKAVRDYTIDSPLCSDLTSEERTTLATKLLDHIEANG